MSIDTMNGADEAIEVEVMPLATIDGTGALAAVDRASIDMQIATAKAYPRSVTGALNEARGLATRDEKTAESMFYVLPRGGKRIEGPSARLAEIMAYSWQNLRADADIVAEDRTHVTAMGTCFDLEKNVAVRVRVKRRITDKNGVRYNEDMIGVTCNAAISIALRNAVFKVIPQVYVNEVYTAARKASLGQGGTTTQKRQNALDWFEKAGASNQQVFEVLGIKGIEDMGEDELIALRGLRTAIKEGETSVEQAFRRHDVSDGSSELNEALTKNEKPKEEPDLDLEGDMLDLPDVNGEHSITELEEMAGVGPKDREAICEGLGIKSPVHDPDLYAEKLREIIEERNEVEA
jgi:hypothetical protein